MKNKKICLLAVVLVLSVLFSACSFSEKKTDYTISEDGATLVFDNVEYTAVTVPEGYDLHPFVETRIYEDSYYDIFWTPAENSGILVHEEFSGSTVYATEEAMKLLEEYFDGTKLSYILIDSSRYADIDDNTVEMLDAMYSTDATLTVDVTDLSAAPMLSVTERDTAGMFSYRHGAIYCLDDMFVYIDYRALDNTYFDSNGYFSYRKGSVKALDLTGIFDAAAVTFDGNYITQVVHIVDEDSEADQRSVLKVYSLVMITIIGIMLPLVFIILSVIFAFAFKNRSAKCWFIVTGTAAFWLMLGLCLFLFILLSPVK